MKLAEPIENISRVERGGEDLSHKLKLSATIERTTRCWRKSGENLSHSYEAAYIGRPSREWREAEAREGD